MFKNAIVVFIAVGYRTNYVEHNRKFFEDNDCLIFSYNYKFENPTDNCHVMYRKWSWTRFLYQINKYLESTHDFITVVLDDVFIKNYSFSNVVEKMKDYDYSVSTPVVSGSYYNENNIQIKHTELFVSTFTRKAFDCWVNMMDFLQVNFIETVGWGLDLCFPAFCPNVVHLVSPYLAFHKPHTKNFTKHLIGQKEVKRYNYRMRHAGKKKCFTQVR